MKTPAPSSDPEAIRIGADGEVHVENIVRAIRQRVEQGRREGRYDDDTVIRAERNNLFAMQDRPDFVQRYLACMRHAAIVDINDFDIVERRRRFSRILVAFKTALWKMLRFYTYRLWSQQNQVNGILLAAVEMLEDRYRQRFAALEQRIAALEGRVPDKGNGQAADANRDPATEAPPA